MAIGWSLQARAIAGFVQGLAMAGVGVGAIGQIGYRILGGGAPSPTSMGVVAMLALAVNVYCAYRLVSFRAGDASMRAIWLSTRNDAMLNVLTVLTAAAAWVIALTGSGWPGIIAGATIASLNLWASIEVTGSAITEMRRLQSDQSTTPRRA